MAATAFGLRTRLGTAIAVAALLLPLAARADFHIRSPDEIDQGEIEIEHNGSATIDRNPAKAGETSYTTEFGYGVNSWWHPEFELDFGRDAGPGATTQFQGVTWENTFMLTEPGEYWADLGLYWEYSYSLLRGTPDDTLFGPLIQKDIGHTTHTLNLFLSKEIGPNQDVRGVDFSYAWQSRWNVYQLASPAVEIYGDAGRAAPFAKFQNQQALAGPVLVGSVLLGKLGKLKYEAGYLFGATRATASGTVRWRLEWEMHF
ncbi:MAG TPA: hypothetical protein VL244_13445 [Alphaproteobacteria bacterium]|nr:hypothetical protein [Alphaproteobacteria bacterium]